jgi:hypothetical protein
MTEHSGVRVDSDLQSDLSTIVNEATPSVLMQHQQGSFERIFWEQQVKALSLKNSRSMKWHPLMIRWCIYLRHVSSSAYETIRSIIKLPSQRTLRDYTYYTQAKPCFSAVVDKQLLDYANMTCDGDSYVILMMDEMHIRDDIVYDKHSGSMIGFTNLGEINSHLSSYENSLNSHISGMSELPPVANSVLVLFVRGLFSSLQFPYAQFPCRAVRGYFDIF